MNLEEKIAQAIKETLVIQNPTSIKYAVDKIMKLWNTMEPVKPTKTEKP